MRRLAVLGGLTVVLAAPATANVPPPIPIFTYYGPLRHCGEGYALDAGTGEAMLVIGMGDATVRFGRHTLGVSRMPSGYGVITDPAIIRRTGTLTVPGVGAFERYRVSAGTPDSVRVTYLRDPGDGVARSRWMEISSSAFDGSDGDRAVLRRVAFGERAAAMCADVPAALRPSADRLRADAFLMREPRYRGPFTWCWSAMAMDVAAGEEAVLPWTPDANRFAIVAPALEVAVAGDFRSGSSPTGALPTGVLGPLLPYAMHFTLGTGSRYSGSHTYVRAGAVATNLARLVANRDIRTIGPDPGPGLNFAFSRAVTDAERDAFIGRVRARGPSDPCFDPDKA